ncbi:hypothetical protein K505DRAFT_258073 [Melanomma pulvis-pyrius CBS 109.77]|uniref:Rhodopsin domain-containing protein n=1 Tax=Melanomma pulvis-pyrius CBS 109.77 TaxID=1314802 RepID=A0A6A6WT48_9PLEO|nr:hypothetical protein K505DRAFT_258073 [Melanomma pulvis-pyrius CBS 109.77]
MNIPNDLPPNAIETQTSSARIVTMSACLVVSIAVFLRYVGRWALQLHLNAGPGKREGVYGLDDVFNVAAVLAFYGLAVAVFVAIHRGMGVHVEAVLYERGQKGLTNLNQAIFVCAIFYNITLGMIKLSVLSLYRRILRGIASHKMCTILRAMFVIVACNTMANVLVVVFQCWPIEATWDSRRIRNSSRADRYRCVNINAFYIGNSVTGMLTDAMVYLVSIPIVKPLQMDSRTKIQLLATTLVGGLAVITSAVRLGFLPKLLHDPDVTMAMAVPMDWSVIEPAVGIIVSSMPAIRAIRFLRRQEENNSHGLGAISRPATNHIPLGNASNGTGGGRAGGEGGRI